MRAHGLNCIRPIPMISPGSDNTRTRINTKPPIMPRMGMAVRLSEEWSDKPTTAETPPKIKSTNIAARTPRPPKTICKIPKIFTCCAMPPSRLG
jgi:hypothetical protein